MKKTLSFIILCLFSILVFGFSKNVVANEEINYLALGDSTIDGRNTYVDSFQNDYLKASTYTKLSKKGARLEDLYVLLDSEFVTDEYFSTLKLDSTKYVDAIKNADLITLSYNNMDYALKQLKMASLKPYTNVWERFFNEEKMLEVTKILDEFRTNLNNSNVPMVDMVILVIESYAYNYVSTVFTYSKVIEKIKEINPQCDILSVEMYNPLDGIILQIGEFSIDVGMYFNELIALVKETAIVSMVGSTIGTLTFDLNQATSTINKSIANYLAPAILAAILYLIIVYGITLLIKLIERKFSVSDKY